MRVHYSIWVHTLLDHFHNLNWLFTLRVWQIFPWRLSDANFSTDTSLTLPDEIHHERVDILLKSLHKVMVLIPWKGDVDRNVSICYVSISDCNYVFFFLWWECWRIGNEFSSRLSHLVVIIDWSWGNIYCQSLYINQRSKEETWLTYPWLVAPLMHSFLKNHNWSCFF